MSRKPQEKPEGEQQVKREARKSRAPESPHCGDMGLASREQQFRPGTGGR